MKRIEKTGPRLNRFLETAGIELIPVGIFDVSDPSPFEPFARPEQCIFGHFTAWQSGRSTLVNPENAPAYGCPGAAYWLCGIHGMSREVVVAYLFGQEGLKSSADIMNQWMDTHPPYTPENGNIVISRMDSPAADAHTHQLKTVTFFIRPDQLALLVTGAEYCNGSPGVLPVTAVYGAGCGQMLSHFETLDTPQAMIGATDIAVRKHLPPDILALTATPAMFEQLLDLDGASFLNGTFWKDLKQIRTA